MDVRSQFSLSPSPSLEIEPAEDSGTSTSSRYNFQYQCAARHCFGMLTSDELEAVTCEWHVDYSLHYSNGKIELVSVKHREPQIGPWTFADLWDKGGLQRLFEHWQGDTSLYCRLVTNAAMKGQKDWALRLAKACLESNATPSGEVSAKVAEKLGCTPDIAAGFISRLSIEHSVPDRVSIRPHCVLGIAKGALRQIEVGNIEPEVAWDAVVALVALKSRDYDNRDYSGISFSAPDALSFQRLTGEKAKRRTIYASDVQSAVLAPQKLLQSPKVSNIWRREPSQIFAGREEALAHIKECLHRGDDSPALAVVGMSGVGKTELLTQYAHGHVGDYEFVWWVQADSWNSMLSDLSDLASGLGLPPLKSLQAVQQMREHLRERKGLILVDGAAFTKEAMAFIPRNSGCRFLLSSLDQGWRAHTEILKLHPLESASATDLLSQLLPTSSEEDLQELNSSLDGLPLALKQAAGFMQYTGMSVSTYTRLIRDRAGELLKDGVPPEHPGLAAAWEITADRLKDAQPEAYRLLEVLCFVAPTYFPTQLFHLRGRRPEAKRPEDPHDQEAWITRDAGAELEGLSQGAKQILTDLEDELVLHRRIGDLQRFSLLNIHPGGVQVHSLTQALGRHSMTADERDEALSVATSLVHIVAEADPLDSRYWPHYVQMMPHFDTVGDHLQREGAWTANRLLLCCAMSMNLGARGLRLPSLIYAEKASEIVEESIGRLETYFVVQATLVQALIGADRLDDALAKATACLNHPDAIDADPISLATMHSKLAVAYLYKGSLAEARAEFQSTAEAVSELPDSPTVSHIRIVALGNQANLLREMGDARGAIREISKIIPEYSGKPSSHIQLATLYSNLGLAFFQNGDFSLSLKNFKKALEIDFEIYEGAHPNAARELNQVGLVQLEMGLVAEAIKSFETALQIHETLGSRSSMNSLLCQMNLARCWLAHMDFGRARRALESVLSQQELLLGSEHRDIATTLANLSAAYGGLSMWGNAVKAARRAIDIDTATYGSMHPELIPDYCNLAGALISMRRPEAAKKWLDKSRVIILKNYGSSSVRYADYLERSAFCQDGIGNRAAAIGMLEEAKVIYANMADNHKAKLKSCNEFLVRLRANLPLIG